MSFDKDQLIKTSAFIEEVTHTINVEGVNRFDVLSFANDLEENKSITINEDIYKNFIALGLPYTQQYSESGDSNFAVTIIPIKNYKDEIIGAYMVALDNDKVLYDLEQEFRKSLNRIVTIIILDIFVIYVFSYQIGNPLVNFRQQIESKCFIKGGAMKKCTKCNCKGTDFLYYGNVAKKIKFINLTYGSKHKQFCRNHLLDELRNHFLNFNGKLIVYYPDLEDKNQMYQYVYANLDEKQSIFDSKLLNEKIQGSLKSIDNTFCNCGKLAQVAYYPKGTLKWELIGKWYQVKWDVPLFENTKEPPEILCLDCAFKYISASLMQFKGTLSDGLSIPYGKSGIYFPTQV